MKIITYLVDKFREEISYKTKLSKFEYDVKLLSNPDEYAAKKFNLKQIKPEHREIFCLCLKYGMTMREALVAHKKLAVGERLSEYTADDMLRMSIALGNFKSLLEA